MAANHNSETPDIAITRSKWDNSLRLPYVDCSYDQENDNDFPFSDQEDGSDSEYNLGSINTSCSNSSTFDGKDKTLKHRRQGSFTIRRNSSFYSRSFDPYSPKRSIKWIHKHFLTYPVKLKERHYKKLRKICAHGIDPASRAEIWYLLASRLSTAPLISSKGESLLPSDPSTLDSLLTTTCQSYASVNPNPKWSDLILKDLRRCIADDENFNNANGVGYKALNKVLFAFSVHNADVGYCQGLGPLVAFILNVFNEDKTILDEWEWERAFWLVHFLNSDNRYMRDYNTPGLEGVIVDLWLFGEMVRKYLPKQNNILATFGFEPTLYAQAWFFCLFVRTLPIELCVRIWDMYICEGKFVMYKTALLILYIVCHKNKQLIKNEDEEQFLHALQHPDPKWFKTEKFVERVVKFRIDTKHKRRFLEQAEAFRYEQFGAKHTITSNAPELRYEIRETDFDPISEIDNSESRFHSDDAISTANSLCYDNEITIFSTNAVNSNTLTDLESQSEAKKDSTLVPLPDVIHVKVDSNTSNDNMSEEAGFVSGPKNFVFGINRKSSAKGSEENISPNNSPLALSACSSSTSEHKEMTTF